MVGRLCKFLLAACRPDVRKIRLQLGVPFLSRLHHRVGVGKHPFRDIYFRKRRGHGLPGQPDIGGLGFAQRSLGVRQGGHGAGKAAFRLGQVGRRGCPEVQALALRSEDFLMPRHILLCEAQDFTPPQVIHMGDEAIQTE